jgi:hypothetical protein
VRKEVFSAVYCYADNIYVHINRCSYCTYCDKFDIEKNLVDCAYDDEEE